jgi:hypothetical protein
MKTPLPIKGLLACILPAASLVSGCGGSSSDALTPSTTTPSIGAAREPVWTSPDAMTKALLYVSDDRDNLVTVYGYKKGKGKNPLVGKLTGLSGPKGECTDTKGNVWILETGASQLVEYAHGGTKAVATLSDSGYVPFACSVDPTSGNLAVSNNGRSSNEGNVAIFQDAKGKPTYYSDSQIFGYAYCGYDDDGNLFVDGTDYSDHFEFAELAQGGSALAGVTLNQAIESPGAIQWDGTYLAVGDQSDATIYQFTIKSGQGTEAGSTHMNGTLGVEQFSIQGKVLIAPDLVKSRVWFFAYPAGGNSFGEVLFYVSSPVAAVVSKAT